MHGIFKLALNWLAERATVCYQRQKEACGVCTIHLKSWVTLVCSWCWSSLVPKLVRLLVLGESARNDDQGEAGRSREVYIGG